MHPTFVQEKATINYILSKNNSRTKRRSITQIGGTSTSSLPSPTTPSSSTITDAKDANILLNIPPVSSSFDLYYNSIYEYLTQVFRPLLDLFNQHSQSFQNIVSTSSSAPPRPIRSQVSPTGASEPENGSIGDISSSQQHSHSHHHSQHMDLLIDCVLPCIVDKLGGVRNRGRPDVFEVAKPSAWLENYKSTMKFLRQLEDMASTKQQIEHMRNSPHYIELQNKLQTPVYFQIRYKDITTRLEDTFTTSSQISKKHKLTPEGFRISSVLLPASSTSRSSSSSSTPSQVLFFPCSLSILEIVYELWEPAQFIEPLAHRFLKLTLQCFTRFEQWVYNLWEKCIESAIIQDTTQQQQQQQQQQQPNATSQEQPDQNSIGHISAMEAFVCIRHDRNMVRYILKHHIEDCIIRQLEGYIAAQLIKDALKEIWLDSKINSLQNQSTSIIAKHLVQLSTESLSMAKVVVQQYRGTGRQAPTAASVYVADLLKPASQWFNTWAIAIKPNGKLNQSEDTSKEDKAEEEQQKEDHDESLRKVIASQVCDSIAERLANIIDDTIQNLNKVEESLRKLQKRTLRMGGGVDSTPTTPQEISQLTDYEKICQQYILDTRALEEEIVKLDIDPKGLMGVRHLHDLVGRFAVPEPSTLQNMNT